MARQIPADLVIENVTVVTMNPLCPFAKGVAVTKGKIVGLIHNSNEIWPLAPGGERVNYNGMTVIPGLIDAHCHLRAQISRDLAVPCGRKHISNIEDIIIAIRERAGQQAAGTWIRAAGYDPFYLKEKRHPTRWELDKATTNHPIRLRHVSRHASVLNSAALDKAGIDRNSTDPPGITVEREPKTRIPTGVVYGGDTWLSRHVIMPITPNELHRGADRLQTMLLSTGITAVQDATPTNTLDDLNFWASRIDNNWPIAIQLMSEEMNHAHMTNFLGNEIPKNISNRLEMGPVKVVLEALPELFPRPEVLLRIAVEATRRGFPLAVHVVDPEMVWAAIDAFRNVSEINPGRKIQHRLEHLSLCPEAFLPDIAKLGLMVVTNPSLIYDHGDRYLADVEISEHNWLYRMKSLLSEGIALAAGSDAPVAAFNPWVGIQTSCTRTTSSGKIFVPDEKLSRWQSLEMYTTGAARAAGWQNIRGMIRPGHHADLVVIDQNPLTCPVESLSDIQINSTWISGKLVYEN
ncbi:amidohydrolase [Neobacillus niacini]|uniref:amidohydrolase n=1 Tax=Neobacillus niacini TaxID=86668 RepID=UPI00398322FA